LKIPPLRHYGVAARDLEELVDQGAKASSMKANPIPLTRDELKEVLERAL
jgi:alcohol dehydrogenase class IV